MPVDRAGTQTRSPLSYRKGWDTKFTLGGNYNRGNQNNLDGFAGVDYLMYCWKNGYSLNLIANGSIKSKDNSIYRQAAQVVARFDNRVAELGRDHSLWLGVLTTFFHDKALDIDARITMGGGVRLRSFFDSVDNDFSLFVIPEYTLHKTYDDQYITRASLRNTSKIPIKDVVSLGLDLFFTPDITDLKNFRATVAPTLNVHVSDWLDVGLKGTYQYNSRPAGYPNSDVKKHDVTTFFTLTLKGGRQSDVDRKIEK